MSNAGALKVGRRAPIWWRRMLLKMLKLSPWIGRSPRTRGRQAHASVAVISRRVRGDMKEICYELRSI